jgi:hypothetical protein
LREARESPQVQAVTTGLPRTVVYGLYVLSPVNHSVCHRHQHDALGIIANLSARPWGARTTRLFLKRFLEEKSGDKSGGYEN